MNARAVSPTEVWTDGRMDTGEEGAKGNMGALMDGRERLRGCREEIKKEMSCGRQTEKRMEGPAYLGYSTPLRPTGE